MLRQDATSASGDRQWGAHQDSSSRFLLCHRGSEGRRTQDGTEKTGWDTRLALSRKGHSDDCEVAPGAAVVMDRRDVDTVASQLVCALLSWPSALVFWADITSIPP